MVLFVPHKRPQLLPVLVGIVAEALLELAHNWNRVLKRVFPVLKGSRIWGLGRHGYFYKAQSALPLLSRGHGDLEAQ